MYTEKNIICKRNCSISTTVDFEKIANGNPYGYTHPHESGGGPLPHFTSSALLFPPLHAHNSTNSQKY